MMVYQEKCVMCVLHKGVPQQELRNGTVILPFGTEYSVRFRNKHNRRAVVQFWIDGEPMHRDSEHGGYVIPANGYIDIERPYEVAKKFKFVDLDSPEAVDHGKNGPNYDKTKGLIEAKFFLEKESQPVQETVDPYLPYYPPYEPYRPMPKPAPWPRPYILHTRSVQLSSSLSSSLSSEVPVSSAVFNMSSQGMVKEGATVEGSRSSQRFSSVEIDVDWSHAITLKLFLMGKTETPKNQVVIANDSTETSFTQLSESIQKAIKEEEEAIREKLLAELEDVENKKRQLQEKLEKLL